MDKALLMSCMQLRQSEAAIASGERHSSVGIEAIVPSRSYLVWYSAGHNTERARAMHLVFVQQPLAHGVEQPFLTVTAEVSVGTSMLDCSAPTNHLTGAGGVS